MRHFGGYQGTSWKRWLPIWSQSQCLEWYCWCKFGLIGWKVAAWCLLSFPLGYQTCWGRFPLQSWLPEWWRGEEWDSSNLRNRKWPRAYPWKLEKMGIRKYPSMQISTVWGGHWCSYLKILHFSIMEICRCHISWCPPLFSLTVATLIHLEGSFQATSHSISDFYFCSIIFSLAITFLINRPNPHPSLAIAALAGAPHPWIRRFST